MNEFVLAATGVGLYQRDLATNRSTSSRSLTTLLELGDHPTLEELRQRLQPEDREALIAATDRALADRADYHLDVTVTWRAARCATSMRAGASPAMPAGARAAARRVHRRDRAPAARSAAAPGAEDGDHRPAGQRRRARFQQPADRHRRLRALPRAELTNEVAQNGPRRDPEGGRSRHGADAPAPRLQPQARARADRLRRQRAHHRSVLDGEAPARRARHADRPRSIPTRRPSTPIAARSSRRCSISRSMRGTPCRAAASCGSARAPSPMRPARGGALPSPIPERGCRRTCRRRSSNRSSRPSPKARAPASAWRPSSRSSTNSTAASASTARRAGHHVRDRASGQLGPSRPSAPSSRAIAIGGTERVLLVEDDEDVRALSQSILERAGYAVRTAASVADAIAILDHEPIDAMVSDVMIAGGTGWDIYRRGRAHATRSSRAVRVGYALDALDTQSLDTHAAFLPKPFTSASLLQRLRSLLDRP